MRIAGGVFFHQTDLFQHLNHLTVNFRTVFLPADLKAFAYDFLYGHLRVKGFYRILEDHGDI